MAITYDLVRYPRLMMVVRANASPDVKRDFNDWYDNEHVPEIVDLPGCQSAHRYTTIEDARFYYAFYYFDNDRERYQADYVAYGQNPTEWTQRMEPEFIDEQRFVGPVSAAIGRGIGNSVALIELEHAPAEPDVARSHFEKQLLPRLIALTDVASVELFEADPESSNVGNQPLPEPRWSHWLIVAQLMDPSAIDSVREIQASVGHLAEPAKLLTHRSSHWHRPRA